MHFNQFIKNICTNGPHTWFILVMYIGKISFFYNPSSFMYWKLEFLEWTHITHQIPRESMEKWRRWSRTNHTPTAVTPCLWTPQKFLEQYQPQDLLWVECFPQKFTCWEFNPHFHMLRVFRWGHCKVNWNFLAHEGRALIRHQWRISRGR